MSVFSQCFELEKLISQRTTFFVTGYPKSGTTWLERLINAHPDALCYGEDDFEYLGAALARMCTEYNQHSQIRNTGLPVDDYCIFQQQDISFLQGFLTLYLLGNRSGANQLKAVGSKANMIAISQKVDQYANWLPATCFIHIIRDPRDVLVSSYVHNRRINPAQAEKMWPDLPSFIRATLPNMMQSVKVMSDFGKKYPRRYMMVRYEDLLVSPFEILNKVFSMLSLECGRDVVRSCVDQNTFEALTKGRKSGEEDSNSFMRKGIHGDWRNKLDQQALDLFTELGGDRFVRETGYE